MITWQPIAMRSGQRVDGAIVDLAPVAEEQFLRRRAPGVERFEIAGVLLPVVSNESAALALWRARGKSPQRADSKGRG